MRTNSFIHRYSKQFLFYQIELFIHDKKEIDFQSEMILKIFLFLLLARVSLIYIYQTSDKIA